MIFRASQRSRIGGRLAAHCVKRRLSGLQWQLNGGGVNRHHYFSVISTVGFQINHYSNSTLTSFHESGLQGWLTTCQPPLFSCAIAFVERVDDRFFLGAS